MILPTRVFGLPPVHGQIFHEQSFGSFDAVRTFEAAGSMFLGGRDWTDAESATRSQPSLSVPSTRFTSARIRANQL